MFKKIISWAFIISICWSNAVFCMELEREGHSAFIAKQGDKSIKIGNCEESHFPYSTFKVPLALMGFDSGFFKAPDSPTLPFKEEYEKKIQSWYTRDQGLQYNWIQEQTPKSFMKNSCIWVSHLVTEDLGKEKFKEYIVKLNYGNKNVDGGELGSLYDSWLGTSLKISPREQVEFLEKLLSNGFPGISEDAHKNARKVMDREEMWSQWKLYGKTGGGSGDTGWFIGWIEKDGQPIVFAQYLDKKDSNLDLMGLPVHKTVGLTAKEVAKRHLESIWKEAVDQ